VLIEVQAAKAAVPANIGKPMRNAPKVIPHTACLTKMWKS